MARVCTSCGLTTDSQGRLIVNTGGAEWPFGCAESGGSPVYCGSDGVLRVSPEKFHTRNIQYTATRTGQITSATFSSPVVGGGEEDFGSPLVYVLENPSDCLPMTVAVRHGIHHMVWSKTGAGASATLVSSNLTVSGGIVDTDNAHQQWSHSGSVTNVGMDSMNSTKTLVYTLAAGATATFSAQPALTVNSYNGNTVLTNHQNVLDVEAWNP